MSTASHLLSLIFLASFANPTFAQGLASIAGRITDPSGAVVPGASVSIKEVDTGYTRTSLSSAEGYYAIPSLRPAGMTWSFTVRFGFAPAIRF